MILQVLFLPRDGLATFRSPLSKKSQLRFQSPAVMKTVNKITHEINYASRIRSLILTPGLGILCMKDKNLGERGEVTDRNFTGGAGARRAASQYLSITRGASTRMFCQTLVRCYILII